MTRLRVRQIARAIFLAIWQVVSFPFRLWINVRRSMTTTSVTLLLMCIVSLNIVWGFPWIGMFSACVAIATVGILLNRFLSPALRVDVRLPVSVPATEPFHAQIHVTNQRKLPALDLRVGFDVQRPRSLNAWFQRNRESDANSKPRVSSLVPMSMVRPHDHASAGVTVCYSRRGIQTLPPILIESSFPFHIIRSLRRIQPTTSIAITPKPLDSAEASLATTMFRTMEELTAHAHAGESSQYTGSREYQVGVPVRRWDFNSWARLGRPIVREYQSSTLQTVWLIIDSALEPEWTKRRSKAEFEYILSCAAAVIPQWLCRRVRLQMAITCESPHQWMSNATSGSSADVESLLVRLARAEIVGPKVADQRLVDAIEKAEFQPTLLLTMRQQLPEIISQSDSCRVVRLSRQGAER